CSSRLRSRQIWFARLLNSGLERRSPPPLPPQPAASRTAPKQMRGKIQRDIETHVSTRSDGPAERRNRGAQIRTGDLSDPNGARYQAAPHPEIGPEGSGDVRSARRSSSA